MRKWLFFLGILVLVYLLFQMNKGKKPRSPFFKRLNETVSIIVWVLLTAYAVSFLYWLYKALFGG